MKYIQKSKPEQAKLHKFKTWVDENAAHLESLTGTEQWRRLNVERKKELQDTLIEEQGYICAYCNRRIHKGPPEDDEQLRIDHLEPKDTHKDKVFDYYNLVGCCYGDQREKGRETPPRSPHCDVSKDNYTIPSILFPTEVTCEQIVVFSSEGELSSTDSDVNHALQTTLNLNCEKLTVPRKNVITPFADFDFQSEEVNTLITEYQTPNVDGELEPFCGVIIGYLRQNYNYDTQRT